MDSPSRYNKTHTVASTAVGTVYGMTVGVWLGARMSHAHWLEVIAFTLFMLFAPAIAFSIVDSKYLGRE